jgi:hypothetical protein
MAGGARDAVGASKEARIELVVSCLHEISYDGAHSQAREL